MLRHNYYLNHLDGKHSGTWNEQAAQPDTLSGPLNKNQAAKALTARLAQGLAGRIEEYWEGPCRHCGETVSVKAGYFQHGCGEVYDKDATL